MKKVILNLLLAIVSVAVFLLAAETGAFIYYTVRHKRVLNEYANLIEQQGVTARNKKPGEIRLFLVGESAARGVPYTMESSVSGFLAALLNKSGNSNIKVINTGIPGRHSFYQREEGKTLVRYQADAVLIYAGNNDTRDFSNVIRDIPFAWIDFKLTWNSYFYRWLKDKMGNMEESVNKLQKKEIFDLNPNQDDAWHWTDAYIAKKKKYLENPALGLERKRKAIQDYETNLNALAAYLTKHGVRVFVCELPIVHEAEPGTMDVKKGLGPGGKAYELYQKIIFNSPQDEKKWWSEFNLGKDALSKKAYQDAVIHFQTAQKINDTFPTLFHCMGQAWEGLGQYDKAREFYVHDKDIQIQSPGGDSLKNAVLERIAKKYGLPWIRLQPILEEASPHGIVGKNLFLDHCHPNLLGHKLIAAGMMQGFCDAKFIPCDAANKNWKKWFEKLSGGKLNPENIAREYLLTAFYHFNGTPWDAKPDYAKAVLYLEKARELFPANKEIYPLLAASYWKLNQPDKAKEALDQVRRLDPQKFRQALLDFPFLAPLLEKTEPPLRKVG